MTGAVSLDITVDNRRPTLRLQAISDRIGTAGLAAFLQGFAAPLLQERAAARFADEGDSASGPWKPLSDATISRREKAGYVPIKINERTGQMRAWVEGAPGRVFSSKGFAVLEWPGTPSNRTTGKKLKVAQMGLAEPYTPPRPVIAIDPEDQLAILAAAEQWVGMIP